MEEIKPEKRVEIILWNWLKMKSSNFKEVYFNNSKNLLSWKYFTTKGKQFKPDLLISFLYYGKEEWIAVEVKDNSKDKNVLDGKKIGDTYYLDYIKGETKYIVEDKEIKVNHFVVATQSSLLGYLFDKENFNYVKDSKNDSKRLVSKLGLIPNKEGDKTQQYVRDLWGVIKRIYEKNDYKIKPSVGVLISDENGCPRIMVKKWIESKNKSPRWSQRWIQI